MAIPGAAIAPEYAATATTLIMDPQSPTANTPGSLVSKKGWFVSMSPVSVVFRPSCFTKGPFGFVEGAFTCNS